MIKKFIDHINEEVMPIQIVPWFPRNKDEIKVVCDNLRIDDYGVNDDYSIDVYGNVLIMETEFIKLPIKFKHIIGYFSICKNKLNSLIGSPKEVGDFFNCSDNNLGSLEWGPEITSGFDCSKNKLTSLNFGPKFVYEDYSCSDNLLTSLKGCPKTVETFDFESNRIYIIDAFPKVTEKIFYNNNPIAEILNLFNNNHDKKLACEEMITIKPITNDNGRYEINLDLLNQISYSITGSPLNRIPNVFRYYEISD